MADSSCVSNGLKVLCASVLVLSGSEVQTERDESSRALISFSLSTAALAEALSRTSVSAFVASPISREVSETKFALVAAPIADRTGAPIASGAGLTGVGVRWVTAGSSTTFARRGHMRSSAMRAKATRAGTSQRPGEEVLKGRS